jgi:hypothetical protein
MTPLSINVWKCGSSATLWGALNSGWHYLHSNISFLRYFEFLNYWFISRQEITFKHKIKLIFITKNVRQTDFILTWIIKSKHGYHRAYQLLAVIVCNIVFPFLPWTLHTWRCVLHRNRSCLRTTCYCWTPGYCKNATDFLAMIFKNSWFFLWCIVYSTQFHILQHSTLYL